jgi:hypothetical protein
MKKKGFTPEQIINMLRPHLRGTARRGFLLRYTLREALITVNKSQKSPLKLSGSLTLAA